MAEKFRKEKDSLGEFQVPADAWYGIQTARAVENFPISGRRPDTDFIIAHARIKQAAAIANQKSGWLEADISKVIIDAASDITDGKYHDQFVVDRSATT